MGWKPFKMMIQTIILLQYGIGNIPDDDPHHIIATT
jgi:hypothetical protein